MDRREKVDCRANGEVIFRATRSPYLKVPKHVVTGSSAEPNESHSLISTKIGIDPRKKSTDATIEVSSSPDGAPLPFP